MKYVCWLERASRRLAAQSCFLLNDRWRTFAQFRNGGSEGKDAAGIYATNLPQAGPRCVE